MAFDAFFMSAVLAEVKSACLGARVEKIHQPRRDTVLLHLRCEKGREKLLLGMNPAAPRLHLTDANPENPPEPPMFCMLLRKHLSGARLSDIRQLIQKSRQRRPVGTFVQSDAPQAVDDPPLGI